MCSNEKILERMMDYCESTNVHRIEYEADNVKIVIVNHPREDESVEEIEIEQNKSIDIISQRKPTLEKMEVLPNNCLKEICSEMTGIFYDRSSPENDPFISSGQKVSEGDVIGLVEVMKCFIEVKATFTGTVKDIFVCNGMIIEYGQPLALVEEEKE